MLDFQLTLDSAADPQKLQGVFDRYDKYQGQQGADSSHELGPIGSFLFGGDIGKGLVEFARASLAREKCDIAAGEVTCAFEASGQVIQSATWNPFNRDEAVMTLDAEMLPFSISWSPWRKATVPCSTNRRGPRLV